jgi:hypothetical protein
MCCELFQKSNIGQVDKIKTKHYDKYINKN